MVQGVPVFRRQWALPAVLSEDLQGDARDADAVEIAVHGAAEWRGRIPELMMRILRMEGVLLLPVAVYRNQHPIHHPVDEWECCGGECRIPITEQHVMKINAIGGI